MASVGICAVIVCGPSSQAQTPPTVNRAAHPTPAAATTSTAGAPPCTYLECAVRIERGFRGARLVRGANGQTVGKFGFFHSSAVDSLLGGPDSAAANARQYASERHTAAIETLIGLSLGLAVEIHLSSVRSGVNGWDFAGLGAAWVFSIPAARHETRADQSLSRAVWWYNSALPH